MGVYWIIRFWRCRVEGGGCGHEKPFCWGDCLKRGSWAVKKGVFLRRVDTPMHTMNYVSYFIFEDSVSLWMITYSFFCKLFCQTWIFYFFLICHYELLLATIALSMATGASFIFAYDVGYLMYFLNIYTFTLLSHSYEKLWTGMKT